MKKDNILPAEHNISSLEDLCELVNDDNVEELASELKTWLIAYNTAISSMRSMFPVQTDGKKNTELAIGSFVWIEDGIQGIKSVRFSHGDQAIVIEAKEESE